MPNSVEELSYRVSQLEKENKALKERVEFLIMRLADLQVETEAFEHLEYEDAKLRKGDNRA